MRRRSFLETSAALLVATVFARGQTALRTILSGGSKYDADAQDFFTRVAANAGTISDPTKTAVNAFVLAAKSNGYWTKLNRINLFCGGELAAALVPLKVGGGNATDTNVNFVGGDYSEATGLTGNGTTKYLDTGLLANALTANDTHFSVYNRSSSGGNYCGANEGANSFSLTPPYTDGKIYSDQYGAAGGRVVSPSAISTPFGFLVGSRTSSSAHEIYRNGVSLASNATIAGSLPAQAVFIFAINISGVPTAFMSSALAAYSLGSGLTGANVTSYNTDLEAFQDALSRGVQ